MKKKYRIVEGGLIWWLQKSAGPIIAIILSIAALWIWWAIAWTMQTPLE